MRSRRDPEPPPLLRSDLLCVVVSICRLLGNGTKLLATLRTTGGAAGGGNLAAPQARSEVQLDPQACGVSCELPRILAAGVELGIIARGRRPAVQEEVAVSPVVDHHA